MSDLGKENAPKQEVHYDSSKITVGDEDALYIVNGSEIIGVHPQGFGPLPREKIMGETPNAQIYSWQVLNEQFDLKPKE